MLEYSQLKKKTTSVLRNNLMRVQKAAESQCKYLKF